MTNEELFSKSREQGGFDELEKSITVKSIIYTTIIATIISLVIILLKLFIKKEFDFGIVSVFFIFAGFPNMYEGIKNKAKKNIISGGIKLFVAALFFFLCICEVLV